MLGARLVLWIFFASNLYVTLVLLSGGSAAVMSMVGCVVMFSSLIYNYTLFDRKGNERERTTEQDHPVVVVPDNVGGRLPHHVDLERFEWKSHRDSGGGGGTGGNDVRHAQALGDSGTAEEPEPGKAVD